MRFIELSTDDTRGHPRLRGRRSQKGQAIVLIGLMLLVLLGMVGLAVDGGRAYVDRREVQDAVDAGSLAAGDNFLNSNSQSAAESAASREYAANERITGSETDTNWGTDHATASWSGYPGTFSIVVAHNAFNGTDFTLTATHRLTLAFMQALGIPPLIQVAASARSVVMSQSQTPALLTLGQNGCPGGPNGNSLVLQGSANVAIIGALYADGSIQASSNATSVTVAGNAFDNCGGVPGTIQIDCYNPNTNPPSDTGIPVSSGCPAGDYAGAAYTGVPPLPDPGYAGPSLAGLTVQPNPGTNVVLQSGIYPSDPKFPAKTSCYFLRQGVYEWQGGFTANGGVFSNELRPPDEAAPGSLTTRANPNFWYGTGTNVVQCDGSFSVAAVDSHNNKTKPLQPGGTWGVFVTSVRQPVVNGTQYYRESAPSMCRTVTLDGSSKGIQVAVSNVPGATSYNVYGSPSGCGGPFGYLGSVLNPVTESNSSTSTCPALPTLPVTSSVTAPTPAASGIQNSCSLGYVVSDYFDAGTVTLSPFAVSPSYCTLSPSGPTPGCQYPYGSPTAPGANDGGLQAGTYPSSPQDSPLKDVISNGGGDRANEHECRLQTSTSTAAPCAGATVTPGAVQFYFPPNACLAIQGSTNSNFGDLFIFGGLQYYGIVLYAPSGNTCALMKLAGGSQTTLIGTIYTPTANFNIQGGSHTAVEGQVIVGTASIDGTSGTAITYDPGLAPPAPGAKLIY
ncbi:MAG TPA: Tad domain-containing protein [Candidatus Dormibacteraeota bacterium]|nr:Tad domain-containing protein [Candidatus Dormibacteraeota bacterium]